MESIFVSACQSSSYIISTKIVQLIVSAMFYKFVLIIQKSWCGNNLIHKSTQPQACADISIQSYTAKKMIKRMKN